MKAEAYNGGNMLIIEFIYNENDTKVFNEKLYEKNEVV